MLYNLRSDIIYYKTNSDFELEFNICGCCRMRLLTDKPSNKKAFVHSLARAVSRSRVILIAGALFGEESTIKTVAQALGTETEITNNSEFNIATDDEIEIIKGSLPLVSPDGLFGGCIIESGPQTMILLTDNKTLRKTIMTTLIHPYIAELYAAESGQKDESDKISEESQPVVEETAMEEPALETEGLILEDEANLDETTPEVNDLIFDSEAEAVEENAEIIEPLSLVLEEDDETTSDQDDNDDNSINASELILEESLEDKETHISQDIEETAIIMDSEPNEKQSFPEEYTNAFEKLFFEEEPKNNKKSDPVSIPQNDFLYLDDNGDMYSNNSQEPVKKSSRLNVATLIVTAILLLTLIIICYCIFVVADQEGVTAAKYIQTIWQTVFG